MKTSVLISVLAIALSAFVIRPAFYRNLPSAEPFGRKVLEAIQHDSPEEYEALFPTLQDFYLIMEKSRAYGSYLKDAQAEFSVVYEDNVIPSLRTSFRQIVQHGEIRGIDWSSARFIRTDVQETPANASGLATLTIVFSANGLEHRIIMENAFVMNGQWRVGRTARLI